MVSCNCKNQKTYCKCVVSSVLSIITGMWPQHVHILAPLSSESGKKTFCWTPDMDLAFKRMKALMARDCLLTYPNHNKPFHIYTDASSYQMGGYIVQDDKPAAYWLRKLNDSQLKYTVKDKELLSIVIVLTKFCTMLLGAVLHIHTHNLHYHPRPSHLLAQLC